MNWGFIGTGRIAERIMKAFQILPESRVVAAYTRKENNLTAFCDKWSIPKRYNTIRDLIWDPEVEILYLATPHIVHLEHFREAVQAGKPILCEKPMGMSAAETQEMVALAKEHCVFLMEGLWTRFFPIYSKLREILNSGKLGRIYNVMADYSYHDTYDPTRRFFRKDLGGGAMRGAGIYPLALATSVFGELPCQIESMADMKNGIDLHSAALLRFPCGGMAQIHSGFHGRAIQSASIACEKGSVWIPDFLWPSKLVVQTDDGEEVIEIPYEFPGFQFEIQEVERCVKAGKLESEWIPLAESIGLAAALDEMYTIWQNNAM